MIAALFVATNGPYFGLPNVDPWDKVRDALKYAGPWSVVAHPECSRWGKYAEGGPNPKAKRRIIGDDDGCFAHSLKCVEEFGGVLEHPADSLAWPHFGLPIPPRSGEWVRHMFRPGWSCHVEQGHYGHRARKATWLYAVSKHLPILIHGASSGVRMEEGFHSSEERARARAHCRDQANQADIRERARLHSSSISRSARAARRAREAGMTALENLSKRARKLTPDAFRDLLIEIAEGAA